MFANEEKVKRAFTYVEADIEWNREAVNELIDEHYVLKRKVESLDSTVDSLMDIIGAILEPEKPCKKKCKNK